MTENQLNALLYSQTTIHLDGYIIDAWFDDSTGEKHIDVLNKETHQELGFIANGMTVEELREKLISMLV